MDILNEKWFASEKVNSEYFQGLVDIFVDPTPVEFSRLIKEFRFLRGFFDDKRVWVWRGDVLHGDINAPGDHWIEWDGVNATIGWNWETETEYPVSDISEVDDFVRSLPRLSPLLSNFEVRAHSR